MTARLRLILASLAAVALLLGAAGCSFWPKPPADLVAAADAYAAEARALSGVAEARADVTDVDAKDRPGEWRVALYVRAKDVDGLDTVPEAVAGLRPPASSVTYVQVAIPGGAGSAPVTLVDPDPDPDSGLVKRAGMLRALRFATSVAVSNDEAGSTVQLAKGTSLRLAIDALRASGTLTTDPVDSVAVSLGDTTVEVSLAGPSDALVGLIERFNARPGVQNLTSTEPSLVSARPAVSASTNRPDQLAAALAQLDGDQRDGRPRTAFSAYSDTRSVKGFVGLPLGSAEPDDLRPPPPPVDAVAQAAQLAQDTQAVTDFLLSAAQVADTPATPEVYVTDCSGGHTGSLVEGSVLLPVFDHADTAQPAYDAITSAWEKSGYTHSDQAMGTSIYSPQTSQAVAQATIRGTSEGIRITADGRCSG